MRIVFGLDDLEGHGCLDVTQEPAQLLTPLRLGQLAFRHVARTHPENWPSVLDFEETTSVPVRS